jgi:UDP-glucuronate 4-epimerase
VVGVDNFDDFYPEKIKRRNLATASRQPRFVFRHCDFRDIGTGDLGSFDVVVHLAARAGVRASFADPGMYSDVIANGTAALIDRVARAGVRRFVLGSSSSVYGETAGPTAEGSPKAPLSPYGASKLAAERECELLVSRSSLEVVALRFFSVYGPRQRPDQAIAKFTGRMLEGGQITLYGDGSSRRDYTFVDDVVNAIAKAVDRELNFAEKFRVYNVGRGESVSLSSLVGRLTKLTGYHGTVRHAEVQKGDANETFADLSQVRDEIGWEPEVSLEAGLPIFVDWYTKTYGYTKPAIS